MADIGAGESSRSSSPIVVVLRGHGSVFIDQDKNSLTRKPLILIAANQDGGAHVDTALDDTYAKLSKQNSLGLVAVENGKARPMDGPEGATARGIDIRRRHVFEPGNASIDEPALGIDGMVFDRQEDRSERAVSMRSGKKYKRRCGWL
jgi:hypothetical protein